MALSAAELSRLSDLLEQALTLSPGERQAWLAALPPADRPLQGALRDMFDAQAQASPFLETLPRVESPLGPEAGEPQPGDTVGSYRLVRLVARGGMGSVWLADRVDGALHRRVALKLPHLAWGAGLAERMRRERDIGARLEHPHIARLYDAGIDHRGHPFLAFEFIDGVAIDLWCRSRQLPTRARLKLFLQVAQAVAYAHARLVVHRDLKPSNVLVSSDGQVHLLDFGIAKLLHEGPEDANATLRLGAAMTPHYASPEQLLGEPVTVASDVYSLGVLLYELLTGERPHAPDGARGGAGGGPLPLAAWQRAVQHEPPLASQRVADRLLVRGLRGDVDAILAKALRRSPEQRYATVDALADDIQRHLAGEPVRAQPERAGQRWRAMLKRSRASIALGTTAVLAVAVAAVLSLSQMQRANDAAARASAVKDFVLDTFRIETAGDPTGIELRGTPRELLLQRGARLIDVRFDGQPTLQAELHGVVSNLFDEMANFELAELHAARRLEVLSHSGAPSADKAVAAMAVSQALLKLGRAGQAEEPAAQAIGWADGEPRLSVMARLQMAASLAAQSKTEALAGELDRIDAELARETSPATIERALAWGARASLLALKGQGPQAIEQANRAVTLAASIEGAASPRVLNLRWAQWRLLMEFRQVDRARELGASIVADLRQLGGPKDGTAAFAEIYTTAFLFADDPEHRLSFDAAEAIVLADRDIVRQHGCRGIADADAWSDYLLGSLYAAWHDFERAEPLLSQSLARIAPVGDELTLIPYASRALAWAWTVRGEHARGDALLQSQMGLMARRGSPLARSARATLALSQSMQGRHRAAIELIESALPVAGVAQGKAAETASSQPLPAMPPELALWRTAVWLGNGDADQALASLPPAAQLASLPEGDGGWAGEAACVAGRHREGLAALDAYLQREAPRRSPASPFIARARAVQGLCALRAGDRKLAQALARQSRAALPPPSVVSPYFLQPLDKLEGALGTASTVRVARK
ncbi:serine/threonine-protein kinase [Ideonella sp. DXS29W]|uniref:Serine/threonine-protein kinase n=1 Tax=Ideonella lacteola TaxID=2984193 RepID=A0ABU9BYK7_9BURK